MQRIALAGAGTMGAGFVRLFCAAGHPVRAYDATPGVAARAVAGHLGAEAVDSLAELVDGAELCIEAIVEELEPKRRLFAELARHAPARCVLATNTSALPVAAIAEAVPAEVRPRLLGTHFFNPPDIVPAVEVVRAPETGDEAVERVLALLRAVGKEAAVVRDSPGFVANRIQLAMVAEAWRCLEDGVATAEAIDAIVSASFGFRLFAFGPFRTGDFNGLDVHGHVLRTLQAAFGDHFAPPPSLLALVEQAALGTKTGRGAYDYAPGEVEALLAARDRALERLAEVRRELREAGVPDGGLG